MSRQYSDKARGAVPTKDIPLAPTTPRDEDASGYVLARHNCTRVRRRGRNRCSAEGIAFATGSDDVGDAVDAMQLGEATDVSMHEIEQVIRPEHRLYRMLEFEDYSNALTFNRLFASHMTGIALLLVIVAYGLDGEFRTTHYVTLDFWRRLVFLGAGELQREWLVGVVGVDASDVREQRVDALMTELRVVRIMKVRTVMARAPRLEAKRNVTGSARKRKKAKSQAEDARGV